MLRKLVVGLASLPGAGKSELATQLGNLGLDIFHLGTVVRALAKANGFVPTEETREAYLPFYEEYSRQHGQDCLSRMAIKQAEDSNHPVLVDGVRIPADASVIGENGTMFWLHGNLTTLAGRVMSRGRVDDAYINSVGSYVESMKKDLADGGSFAMGAVRDLCQIYLLPVPETQDPTERSERYRSLAMHVIENSGIDWPST